MVEAKAFGTYPDGREITLYRISNQKGMCAEVSSLGAVLVRLWVPDKDGKLADVVLGFDRGEDYLNNDSFFGTVIGPSANRIGKAAFSIEGKAYQIAKNDGENNLHSDKKNGYHKQLWTAEVLENGVQFTLEDKDGNLGFPGNKKISVTYTLSEKNGLRLHYHANSDKKTVLNLTNHSYFNLNGHNSGRIENHELWMAASSYTPSDAGSIPTGEIAPVAGTPMDFTVAKPVGRDIGADFVQLVQAGGYDHNWVIDGWDGTLRHFATVKAPESGRCMEAYTTLPGFQFYAGNFIGEQTGKKGAVYGPRMGLCLETQYYPDSVNHPNFPSCIFGEGREYDSTTEYRFV